MSKDTRLFEKHNISSAIIFYGVVLLYTLWIDIDIGLENIFTILVFTIIFWLANGLRRIKD